MSETESTDDSPDEYRHDTNVVAENIPPDFFVEAHVNDALQEEEDLYSHIEPDYKTFHASGISSPCIRQAYLKKIGYLDMTGALGTFKTGELIHGWLESSFDTLGLDDHYHLEHQVELERDGVRFVGHTDCYAPHRGLIVDFKSRRSFYNHDPPKESHLDQLHVYMAALDARYGKLAYISKADLEVRPSPPSGSFFEYNPDRMADLVNRANKIKTELEANGIPDSPTEIPFDRCDCWQCNSEVLRDEPLLKHV